MLGMISGFQILGLGSGLQILGMISTFPILAMVSVLLILGLINQGMINRLQILDMITNSKSEHDHNQRTSRLT